MNDELRDRTGDLDHANRFLETILTGLRVGVAVLDADMRVLVWNRRAEDLWGLRQDEIIGQHFLNLDIARPPAAPSCSWSNTATPSSRRPAPS